MSGWVAAPLGELAEFRNGLNYTDADLGRGLAVIGVTDFQNNVIADLDNLSEISASALPGPNALIHNDDIVFVRSNGNRKLIGRSLFVNKEPEKATSHSGFTIRCRFHDVRCAPRFYAYLFRGPIIRQTLSAQGGGTNISNLNQGILSQLLVPIPPIKLQRHIASILSSYDDLIENNTRRIAILEEMARHIFEEWFIRFRAPGHKGGPSVESSLGLVPEGWQVRRLSEIAQIVMGQSPKSEHYNVEGRGLPFHQGVTDFDSLFPRHRVYCTDEQRIAESGDILVSVRAPVGRINLTIDRIIIGRGLAAVRPHRDLWCFVLGALRQFFDEEDKIGNDGAIFKSLGRVELEKLAFAFPPEVTLAKFNETATPIWALIQNLTFTNRNLRTQRDLFLPRLVSGEIDVSRTKRVMEAAE